MRILRTMPTVFLLAGCAALMACSTPPPKPQPVNLKLNITASADVNPDAQNRPSPVVIRIYQLKDDAAFKGADFFALYDKEEATLAAALVSGGERHGGKGCCGSSQKEQDRDRGKSRQRQFQRLNLMCNTP